MEQQILHSRKSWLSIVAETAGVSGATIERLEICSDGKWNDSASGSIRAIVQILDDLGRVIGAAAWEGQHAELANGVRLDVGCDLEAAWASRVVGWIDPSLHTNRPERAIAPWDATGRFFERGRAMKLMLRQPEATSFVASSITNMEAA